MRNPFLPPQCYFYLTVQKKKLNVALVHFTVVRAIVFTGKLIVLLAGLRISKTGTLELKHN